MIVFEVEDDLTEEVLCKGNVGTERKFDSERKLREKETEYVCNKELRMEETTLVTSCGARQPSSRATSGRS